jgi:hypothetical protein
MNTSVTAAALVMVLSATAGLGEQQKPSESWTCTYPGFGVDKKSVTRTFTIKGDKLVDAKWGTDNYDLLENNRYAVIAVDHFARSDNPRNVGTVRIFSSTVIIDKTFGHFIYMVGEIGDEPGYREGRCFRED